MTGKIPSFYISENPGITTIVTASTSSASPPNTGIQSPAFLSLLKVAKQTLKDLDEPFLFTQAKQKAYINYAYYPNSWQEASKLHRTIPYDRKMCAMQKLATLAAKHSEVIIRSQGYKNSEGERKTIAERMGDIEVVLGDEKELLRVAQEVFNDAYVIHPAGVDTSTVSVTGEDGIESRVSISVKEEHWELMTEALINLRQSEINSKDYVWPKIFGPEMAGIRPESGIIHLSRAAPEVAAKIAEWVHGEMLNIAGRELYEDELYNVLTPGTQKIRGGISYSEKPATSSEKVSSGEEKVHAMALALEDHKLKNMPLEEALFKRLKEHGYSSSNPAFAHREGENELLVHEKVKILESLTSPEISSASYQAARTRFERLLKQ